MQTLLFLNTVGSMFWLVIGGIVLGLVILGTLGWYFFMKLRYRTVSSNEALIVTGPNLGDEKKETNIYRDNEGRYMKVIRGGGYRMRLFQTATRISLKSFQLHIETPKVYTKEGVGIYATAVATIKIADKLEGIVRYAEQFLGKSQDDISKEVSEVLNSNLRAILSKMTVEQINADRESFNNEVRKIAQQDLNIMGFQITSLGLSNLWDDDDYLKNLGRPQIARVEQNARIAESESRRETEVQQAEDNEAIKRESYSREMNIADARKEKELKDARILTETNRAKAEAESAYELEQEERRLAIERQRIEIREQERSAQLTLERLDRENKVTLEGQEVEIRRQQADAEYYAIRRQAEAEAEAKRIQGQAEAEVIKEKSLAEAEALRLKAAAMAEFKDVVLLEKLIEIMPQFAQAVAEPLSNVESIRILDGGSGSQINSLPGTVTGTMAKLQESMSQMTGLDLTSILNQLTDKQENDNEDDSLEVELEDVSHDNDESDESIE